MSKSASKQTDEYLEQIEKRLTKLYSDAQKDITKAWKEYMSAQDAYIKDLQEAYGRAKEFGTAEEAREIGKQLGIAKAERTLQNDYYKNMVNETTRKMAEVNQTAVAYVNNQMPWVYSINYNEAAKIAGQVGVRFNMVDESTVRRMVLDGDVRLPKKKLNIPRDMRWNTRQLNSAVLQGIVNGETIQQIADRIYPIVNHNMGAAIRNARTMTTGTQNRGRMDSYERLEQDGIVLKKVWMATHDERTRESHAELDGEEVDIHDTFSNGLMFPGDPDGEPEEVYNCRCTMVTRVVGFKKADGRIEYVDVDGYQPEYEFPQLEGEQKQPDFVVANGKDISMTWERRPGKFDFEIEDVINAQGFDGKPRVVSAEEFDRYVQEANDGKGFIAQRTYSAPDQETLDAYRDQLYNGKWYVDCSTGGAQYGQGMYCAADYTGKLSDGIRSEMSHYETVSLSRFAGGDELQARALLAKADLMTKLPPGSEEANALYTMRINEFVEKYGDRYPELTRAGLPGAYTETLTLDPSAKIVTYDDLFKEKIKWESDFRQSFVDDAMYDALKGTKFENNNDAVTFIKFELGQGGSWNAVSKAVESLGGGTEEVFEVVKELRTNMGKIHQAANDALMKHRCNDIGAFAVARGYDAINAQGHGASLSYTVILNRTKLIIKGGK